jgi:hypothetical protein
MCFVNSNKTWEQVERVERRKRTKKKKKKKVSYIKMARPIYALLFKGTEQAVYRSNLQTGQTRDQR